MNIPFFEHFRPFTHSYPNGCMLHFKIYKCKKPKLNAILCHQYTSVFLKSLAKKKINNRNRRPFNWWYTHYSLLTCHCEINFSHVLDYGCWLLLLVVVIVIFIMNDRTQKFKVFIFLFHSQFY